MTSPQVPMLIKEALGRLIVGMAARPDPRLRPADDYYRVLDLIAADREQVRREAIESCSASCRAEIAQQGARRHEHSYFEGMEAGAFNCNIRIRSLLPRPQRRNDR